MNFLFLLQAYPQHGCQHSHPADRHIFLRALQSHPPSHNKRQSIASKLSGQCEVTSKAVKISLVTIVFILSFADQIKDGECAICLEELVQGDTIARLPCLCIYHKGYERLFSTSFLLYDKDVDELYSTIIYEAVLHRTSTTGLDWFIYRCLIRI